MLSISPITIGLRRSNTLRISLGAASAVPDPVFAAAMQRFRVEQMALLEGANVPFVVALEEMM
jgi:hypothetical protein